MIAPKYFRDDIDVLKNALLHRGEDPKIADDIMRMDMRVRELKKKLDDLRKQRNEKGKLIPKLKKEGKDTEELLSELKELAETIKSYENELETLEEKLKNALYRIPNIPHESVPIGKDETENRVISEYKGIEPLSQNPIPHWEIGEKLDIIDLKVAANLSGSRFYLFKNFAAKLERALLNFFLKENEKKGYMEILPPYLVKEEILYGSGQLPKFRDELYKTQDDLYLIPTAEVPLANLHRNEILNEDDLPLKYMSFTPCFRREAGSYGKDVRGIIRLHQFHKVELFKFTTPEASYDELEKMREDAEDLLKKLNLTYHVVALCTGDLGFSAAKTYDLEVWAPGVKRWLEVSSISNTEDFQARRTMTRFRRKGQKRPLYVHTLNGSGLATPRVFIAILETYYKDDGTIEIPDVLKEFM